MKPRTFTTSKILVIALTAATGCSTAVRNEGGAPIAVQAESPPVATATAATPPPSAPREAAAPAARRPMSDDPKLLALRDEMTEQRRETVLAQSARFRPLCDKDGYPLVGNVVRKGPSVDYQPSAFCEDLRKQARR
jgi:hypothetical protein